MKATALLYCKSNVLICFWYLKFPTIESFTYTLISYYVFPPVVSNMYIQVVPNRHPQMIPNMHPEVGILSCVSHVIFHKQSITSTNRVTHVSCANGEINTVDITPGKTEQRTATVAILPTQSCPLYQLMTVCITHLILVLLLSLPHPLF